MKDVRCITCSEDIPVPFADEVKEAPTAEDVETERLPDSLEVWIEVAVRVFELGVETKAENTK